MSFINPKVFLLLLMKKCTFPLSCFLNEKRKVQFKYYKYLLYSCWIVHFFESVGSDTLFCPPIITKGRRFIHIGNNCLIGRYTEINAHEYYAGEKYTPSIIIGDHCNIGAYNHITCCNKIYIGNGVLTGKNVLISDNNHGTFTKSDLLLNPEERRLSTKGSIIIGDRVWIGDNVAIVSGGIIIGEGSILAAHSVITNSVPPYSLVAGSPARIVKQLEVN